MRYGVTILVVIPLSWKHADILWCLQKVKSRLPRTATYLHVKSHQDDAIDWTDILLKTQLNCICDDFTKQALIKG